jgi:hypothetical protein
MNDVAAKFDMKSGELMLVLGERLGRVRCFTPLELSRMTKHDLTEMIQQMACDRGVCIHRYELDQFVEGLSPEHYRELSEGVDIGTVRYELLGKIEGSRDDQNYHIATYLNDELISKRAISADEFYTEGWSL